MKGKIVLLAAVITVVIVYADQTPQNVLPTAKMTVVVYDEFDNLISGANVYFGFSIPKKDGWGVKKKPIIGITTDAGTFTAERQSFQNLKYGAFKDGYEKKLDEYLFKKRSDDGTKWLPINPVVEVRLKKVD